VWKLGRRYAASPLLYDGLLYFFQHVTPILTCLDAATGKPHYAQQRLEGLTTVYASPIGVNNRVYVTGLDGTTLVLEKSKELKILANNKLADGFAASPAVVASELFLRPPPLASRKVKRITQNMKSSSPIVAALGSLISLAIAAACVGVQAEGEAKAAASAAASDAGRSASFSWQTAVPGRRRPLLAVFAPGGLAATPTGQTEKAAYRRPDRISGS
jgi:hypothetical protein